MKSSFIDFVNVILHNLDRFLDSKYTWNTMSPVEALMKLNEMKK